MQIAELKSDTKKGRLNRKLFECLQRPHDNEKKLQANLEHKCQCDNNEPKNKKRKLSQTSFDIESVPAKIVNNNNHTVISEQQQYHIPVVTNLQLDTQLNYENKLSKESLITPEANPTASKVPPVSRLSVESEEGVEDVVMMQLEHLFRADENEPEVDLFESTLCDDFDSLYEVKTKIQEQKNEITSTTVPTIVDEQAAIIKSLDQRLALLESSGVLTNNNTTQDAKSESPKKQKKPSTSKWLCEAYHQKFYLFEKLDELRDGNRKKYIRVSYIHTLGSRSWPNRLKA